MKKLIILSFVFTFIFNFTQAQSVNPALSGEANLNKDCNVINFDSPIFSITGQTASFIYYQVAIAWTSKNASSKSIRFIHGSGFNAWENVNGKSGIVYFNYSVPNVINIWGYEVISYTRPDMQGDECKHLIVDVI